MLGYEPEEVLGKTPYDLMPPEEARRVCELMRVLEQSGAPIVQLENVNLHKDGREVVLETNGRPIVDAEGHLQGFRGVDRDITERKRAAEALKTSERNYREIFNAATDGICVDDPETGAILDVNRSWCEMYRCTPEEARRMKIQDVSQGEAPYAEEDALRWIKKTVTEGPQLFEWLGKRCDGELFWVEITLKRANIGGTDRILAVIRDITERKQMEESLRLTQFSVDSASESIYWIDSEGRFTYVNDAACRELGYSREELLRLAVKDIDPIFRAEAWPALWAKLREQGWLKLESLHRGKDGAVFPVEIEANYLEFGGKSFDCAFVRDISRRKRGEREREELIGRLEAQNAELERFAYTVSHDLKTPLITIKGYLGLLAQDLAGNDQQQAADDMARIGGAADKMYELLHDVLELSRIGRRVNPPEDVQLQDLAAEALELVEGRIAERGVEVVVAPDLPAVYGDRMRLREVLQNLIENAAKHMGDQPRPRIEIGVRRQGDELVCYVRDNGVGIEPRYHERVFGLFDKLDPQSEGTGVGLALVKRIVEVHGGRIWIESEGLGQGATFCFTLPQRA